MNQTLKLVSWNANSLKAHREEFEKFIENQQQKPDLICVQETFLKPSDVFDLSGYSIIRKDRLEKKAGGVMTLIRDGISYTKLETNDFIEQVIIEVHTSTKKLIIGNIYCPPNQTHKEKDLIHLFGGRNTILIGDFNAHSSIFGSKSSNSRGRLLENLIENNNFTVISTGAGTHIGFNGNESPIDIAMTSANLATSCSWNVIRDSIGSDHFPTLVTYNEAPFQEDTTAPTWAFKKADWKRFKSHCQENLSSDNFHIEPDEDPSDAYYRYVEILTDAANISIPKIKSKAGVRSVPYWNSKCQEAVDKRNTALNKMRRTKNIADCIEYRRQKGITQKIIKEAKRSTWRNYCGSLNSKTKMGEIWKTTKKMNGVKQQNTIPNLTKNNTTYVTNSDKAQIFVETFAMASSDDNYSATFQVNRSKFTDNLLPITHPEEDQYMDTAFQFHELRSAIQKCKFNSSPGQDSISYEIIKQIPKTGMKTLLDIYNRIWSRGKLPTIWKHAVINPILKPTKPNDDPCSYRPISLTSTFCKVMERMIAERLMWFLETKGLLNHNQSGFRKNRSCLDQIMRLQDDINKSIHTKGHTIGIFVDLEKAFDMIWKKGLMHKLKMLGIYKQMYDWIEDFLTDRTIQVRVGTELSDIIKLQNGTPQGSVLSPLLFLVMINDLPETENEVKLSIFADDCCIWRSGDKLNSDSAVIQKYFDKFQIWCNQWGFRISETKTTAVIFTRKHEPEKNVELKIGNKNIRFEKSVKFLGMIFDRRLTWNEHISYVVERCKKRLNLLRALSGIDWGANKKTLVMLYRTLIRSIIDYGSEAYDSASYVHKQKIDQLQSKALRICCGAMVITPVAALQVECGEMPLELRRRELQLQYAAKLEASINNPTSSIMKDCWQNHRTYPAGKEPFAIKTGTIREIIDASEIIALNKLPKYPSWEQGIITVDTSLTQAKRNVERSKIETDFKKVVEEKMQEYQNTIQIFTDGSVIVNKTGISYQIPSLNVHENYRLPNNLTIFTVEGAAIVYALKRVSELISDDVTVFTDCLEVVNSLNEEGSETRSHVINLIRNQAYEIYRENGIKTNIVWIPGHSGISGNEAANDGAKEATSRDQIDVHISTSMKDAKTRIRKYIDNEWQRQWNLSTKGREYKRIFVFVFYYFPTCITRIKFDIKVFYKTI